MLDKAVMVLRTVAGSPCGLAELCARTGLPRATAHRLAVGLEVHRLLRRDTDGRWSPGPALRELGEGALDPLPGLRGGCRAPKWAARHRPGGGPATDGCRIGGEGLGRVG